MSLPAEYSLLLNDLNRDVLRAQPSDPLQFCATWFLNRLEQERISSRSLSPPAVPLHRASQPNPSTTRAITPPAPLTNPPAVTPPRKALKLADNPGLAEGPADSYRFGGSGVAAPGTLAALREGGLASGDLPSPYSKSNIQPVYPVPGGNNARAGRISPGPSRNALEALAKRASVAVPRKAESSDEDEDERSDDESLANVPSARGAPVPPAKSYDAYGAASAGGRGSGPSPSRGSNRDDDDMPVGINLGRRTSVSAESLTPSMLNGPAAPKVVIPKTAEQRSRIETSIRGNLLFRNLDEGQYEDVLNAMKEVRVGRGTEVIVQGAVGDYFYVVEDGTFDVYVRGPPTYTYVASADEGQTGAGNAGVRRNTPSPSRGGTTITTQAPAKKVHSYGPGGSFGELALMYNAPRAATVVATSNSATLWALDRVTFRSILMEHTSRKRGMYETFLSSVPILASLTPAERSKVADALEERTYQEGEAVVREGEPGKEFYIVESGRAEVSKVQRDGREEIVGALKTGDYFGGALALTSAQAFKLTFLRAELALINSAPRAATVRVAQGHGRLRVACLGEKAFTRLLGPVIEILARKAEDYNRPAVSGSGGAHENGAGRYGAGYAGRHASSGGGGGSARSSFGSYQARPVGTEA